MSRVIQSYLPVFLRYIDRITHLAEQAGPQDLLARLSPDSFTAVEHFAIAQGYALRAICPLIGEAVPDLDPVTDLPSLTRRGDFVRTYLTAIDPAQLETAGHRSVTHIAGEANLTQPAEAFLTLYAAPNFFFHLNMGYAILRQQGVPVGKGDFDGFHSYPSGFSFVTDAPERA